MSERQSKPNKETKDWAIKAIGHHHVRYVSDRRPRIPATMVSPSIWAHHRSGRLWLVLAMPISEDDFECIFHRGERLLTYDPSWCASSLVCNDGRQHNKGLPPLWCQLFCQSWPLLETSGDSAGETGTHNVHCQSTGCLQESDTYAWHIGIESRCVQRRWQSIADAIRGNMGNMR